MSYKNASSTYKETTIRTAGQGQLIVMLYDEAVKQLTKAVELLELNKTDKRDPGRIELINKAVMKTEEILTELMVSLDFEQGGEISKNLFSLYTWFNRELVEANISQNTTRMKAVKDMLFELRNSWSAVANQTPAEKPNREMVGLNIAG
ncbi:MAG: flagellar export chaperone FliS [Treponema sp.]|nr:flagellar export chaperone FliS [Treponema sp.]MCL2236901.1 flagellar export chaperone FliS [Treponema sp.]